MKLRAPFPYFGSKSRVTEVVWRGFGSDVANYVEPFCGSLAMLLGRPGGAGKIETVNDAACAIANFWRAIKAAPEAVAEACDRPVNECDMHAMHIWLVARFEEIGDRLRSDIDFYDARAAGLWVHGQCAWIGGGWCGGIKRGQPRPNLNSGQGIHALAQKLPHLAVKADGACAGRGIHSTNLPSLGNDRGIFGVSAPPVLDWFLKLRDRLRYVRVACGDWTRVLGDSVLGKGKNVGGRRPCAVFLDCPYSDELRDPDLYSEDDGAISALVRDWALEHGDDPDLRVALCGYAGEHEMPSSWTEYAWKGARGYAAEGNTNRERERIWFSKSCLPLNAQRSLFEEAHV